MMKKVKSIQLTDKPPHPAVGRVFKIQFEDGTEDMVYEETFFHNTDTLYESDSDWSFIVGLELDTENGYFKYEG